MHRPILDNAAAERPAPRAQPGKFSFWRSWVGEFLLIAFALMLFRSVVLDYNVVPSGSMRPTIVEGDYIFVNKLAYDLKLPFTDTALVRWGAPARGDIVVFTPPGETSRYVKRVVGVPGDVLELRHNVLYVNGQPAAHQPLAKRDYQAALPLSGDGDRFLTESLAGRAHAITLMEGVPSPDTFEPIVVPPGQYFMMGDNRDNSKDSRFFGTVTRERIVGRVGSLAVSLDRDHGNRPRWERFLRRLA